MTAFGNMKVNDVWAARDVARPDGEFDVTVDVCSPDDVELYGLRVWFDVTQELQIREPYSTGQSRGTEIVRTVHLRGAMIHGLHLTPAMLTAAGVAQEITDAIHNLEPWRE